MMRPLIYRIMFYRNTWTQWTCLWKYFIACLYTYFSKTSNYQKIVAEIPLIVLTR